MTGLNLKQKDNTMSKLDPQCINGKMGLAVTNRGELIPCCRCDNPNTLNDPKFKKLIAVSKISDYDTIDDILNTPEWINFEKDLRNHIGPPACWYTCRSNKQLDDKQETKLIDTSTNTIIVKQLR